MNTKMSAPTAIILQIIGWSIGMMIISQLLGKKFGISATQQMDMQNKMQDFQEQLQLSQADPQRMQELQIEMMEFMKIMMKKQLIPQIVRLLIFFGFFGLLGLIYGDYKTGILPFKVLIFGDGYLGVYILTSFGISMVLGLIRMLIKKIRPDTDKKQEQFQDSVRALQKNLIIAQQPNMRYGSPYGQAAMQGLPMTSSPASQSWKEKINEESTTIPSSKPKSWKEKLE
jgi:uncharacterized membrane protein (DUF106 family)